MKKIFLSLLFLALAFATFAQSNEITISIVNVGDTAYYRKYRVVNNDDPNIYEEKQEYIGPDTVTLVKYLDNLLAKSANAHTKVGGMETELFNANEEAVAFSRDVNTIAIAITGSNLIQLNAVAYGSNFTGEWVIKDMVADTVATYTFVLNGNSATLVNNADSNNIITCRLRSPSVIELRNYPSNGIHSVLALRQEMDNKPGSFLYTDLLKTATGGYSFSVAGVRTPATQ